MKFLLAFLCLVAVAFACEPDNTNGKPLCNDQTTMVGKDYRNHWDAPAFWHCESVGNAVPKRCPVNNLFSEAEGHCIPVGKWRWTPTCKHDV